ncbi:MAG: NFYB/HAP3 family transcription factor subunit [Candidatus Aenigmarchaeota archaeon]|nr:NFYB/HAP3 family transcription factor subunit [Candidatus Aenigmarchaeota archaeon]
MTELPYAACERILRKIGGGRVGKDAVDEFTKVLEGVAIELSAEAATMARHAGRKTIVDADVRLAKKKLV